MAKIDSELIYKILDNYTDRFLEEKLEAKENTQFAKEKRLDLQLVTIEIIRRRIKRLDKAIEAFEKENLDR